MCESADKLRPLIMIRDDLQEAALILFFVLTKAALDTAAHPE